MGAFSSSCGQVVAYPLQLIRTKLQAQGMEGRPRRYKGILDCFRQTTRDHGLKGLYKGIGPNFLKAVPAISISYLVYEKTSRYLKRTFQRNAWWDALDESGNKELWREVHMNVLYLLHMCGTSTRTGRGYKINIKETHGRKMRVAVTRKYFWVKKTEKQFEHLFYFLWPQTSAYLHVCVPCECV